MARTTRKGEKPGRWALVIGLTFVVALGLALLILWLYRSSGPSQPAPAGGMTLPGLPASLSEAPTARQFYPAAAEVARSWQSDARVAALSAHWRSERGYRSADVTWTYRFYSPATQRVAVVIVEGGRARLLREALSPYRHVTFDEADWQVDSDAALDAWWREGGRTFIYIHPEADVTVRLRAQPGEGDRLAWTVTGILGDQVSRLVIDGATSEQIQD
jgi:hypothetical protein